MDSPWYSDRIMHSGRYCLPLSVASVNISFAIGRSLEQIKIDFPRLLMKRDTHHSEDLSERVSKVELHPFEPRFEFIQVILFFQYILAILVCFLENFCFKTGNA